MDRERLLLAWSGGRLGRVVDAARMLVLTAVVVGGSVGEAYPSQPANRGTPGHLVTHPPSALFALVALAGLVLIWRRRWPVAVLAVSLTAVLIYTGLGYVDGAALLAPMVALYSVAVTGTLRRAVVLGGVSLVSLMAVDAAFEPFGATGGSVLVIPFEVAASVLLGLAVANRRAYVSAAEDRVALAERTREEDARRRVDAERLRIARELHDVVAHTMAMINVRAGVAVHVIDTQPQQATEALVAIKQASKEGLRELRAILNILRQADEVEPTEPAPRLAQLAQLVAATTDAGLPTSVEVSGTPRTLPPSVDLAAYRVVQESLTNALRYAAPAVTKVSLCYQAGELTIEVRDAGNGRLHADPSMGAGHGIAGMRERAAATGGTLDAGRLPGGGFLVRARLPLEAAQ
jgi:signal transduction histidine kinase